MPAMIGLLRRMFYGPWSATLVGEGSGPTPFVSTHGALRYTPIYRAVSLIANDAARVPLEISATGADSVLRSPSPYMPAFEFRRAMTMQMLLWGNACAAINRTRGGELLELILLDPETVSIDVSGKVAVYNTSEFGKLQPEQVFHLRAPSAVGIWGESPIGLCRRAVEIIAAQEQMTHQAYVNAGNPKIAIVHPGKLSMENLQKIEADYMKRHQGSLNAGRPLVLGEGVKLERISSTVDDTGLEAAKRYSIGDVSRLFGVPASYLSENVGTSYGSIEWLSRMYVDACLVHWLESWRSEILAKLASPFDTVTFDLDALIRPGIAEHMAALRTGVEGGFVTRNEARAKLDLEPLDGLDEPTLALNVGTGGGSTNIGTDTSAQEGTADDF
jgi:HK97 family phage portal protein